VVTPAVDMPAEALRSGAKLVIINRGDTHFDRYAELRFFETIGDVLPPAVKVLKTDGPRRVKGSIFSLAAVTFLTLS
jgi:NAD-dependent SIR2 family protein deacetylase